MHWEKQRASGKRQHVTVIKDFLYDIGTPGGQMTVAQATLTQVFPDFPTFSLEALQCSSDTRLCMIHLVHMDPSEMS